jgi:hypothetical protein
MADTAALTASVLTRVAEFLKSLPADQLDDLAAGTAKLAVVPKGGRVAASRRAAPTPSTVDAEEVRRMLGGFTTVADAARYVDGLRLTAAPLKALAADLGVTVAARATKDQVRDAIVRAYVGDVLNSEAIRRQAAGL